MMSMLGPHAVFIVAAYAIALVVLLGLVAWVLIDRRQLARSLDELQARGITRRSQQGRQP